MKQLPILFNTEMVQALLAGRKTQTRRLIKPQPIIDEDSGYVFDGNHKKQFDLHNWQQPFIETFSKYQIGDELYVKEPLIQFWEDGTYYLADKEVWWEDDGFVYKSGIGKVPPQHMPIGAARIFLKVTNIRIERACDISESDAIAEGVLPTARFNVNGVEIQHYFDYSGDTISQMQTAKGSFLSLFESIYGREALNSYVFVYDFEKIEKP